MGTLLAQRILGEEPAMPLFDPARVAVPKPAAAGPAAPTPQPNPAYA
jgi:hypothetical protein